MKKPVLLLCAVATATTTAFGQAAKAPDANTQAQLMAFEKAAWEACKSKQQAWFQEHMAADMTTTSGGTKADFMQLVADTQLKTYSISRLNVKMLDTNTALVTSTVAQSGTYKGSGLPGKVTGGTIYVRRGSKWQLVFHAEEPQ